MTSPVIYAAAYLLLVGQPPTEAPVPSPIYDPVMCQLPTPPAPVSGRMGPHRLAVVHMILRHHRRHRAQPCPPWACGGRHGRGR